MNIPRLLKAKLKPVDPELKWVEGARRASMRPSTRCFFTAPGGMLSKLKYVMDEQVWPPARFLRARIDEELKHER